MINVKYYHPAYGLSDLELSYHQLKDHDSEFYINRHLKIYHMSKQRKGLAIVELILSIVPALIKIFTKKPKNGQAR